MKILKHFFYFGIFFFYQIIEIFFEMIFFSQNFKILLRNKKKLFRFVFSFLFRFILVLFRNFISKHFYFIPKKGFHYGGKPYY